MLGDTHEVAVNALWVHLVDIRSNLAAQSTFLFCPLKAGLTNTFQDISTLRFYLWSA